MKKHSTLFCIFFACLLNLFGQADISNMYQQNYYLINPASIGLNECWDIHTGYRKQWTGVSSSPTQVYLSATSKLGQSQGLGLFVSHASFNLISYLDAKASYAYQVNLTSTSSLHFGASVGFGHRRLDLSEIIATDYSDFILTADPNAMGIKSDLGILFQTNRFQLGAALPQLFHPDFHKSAETRNWYDYYIIHSSYNLVHNDRWLVQSIAFYKQNQIGNGADMGLRTLWNNQFGLGAGYRTNNGAYVKAEIHLNDQFNLNYGYELGSEQIYQSHEIMLGIKLCKKPRQVINETSPVTLPIANREVYEPEITKNEPIKISEPEEIISNPEPEELIETTPLLTEEELDSINSTFETQEMLIIFELNSDDEIVSSNQEKVVNAAAKIYALQPDVQITVIGHSCNLGSEEVNQKISEQRAEFIAKQLIAKGIPESQISHLGKGESIPLTTGKSPEERSKNRRVQIIFNID